MTAFVGLDLAWTSTHETGVCVLVGDADGVRLTVLECRKATPGEFASFCASFGEDVVAAIDAPLVVTDNRRAEAELGRVYGGRRHAGAYTATMKFLEDMKGRAGPDLAGWLVRAGFDVAPEHFTRTASGRWALEVFPHPAHIELFSLDRALKYKKGRVACRRLALKDYQHHLRTLLATELPAVLESREAFDVLDPAGADAKGRALKCLEDRLDALTCAYVAYHCWRHGPDGFRVFGSGKHGCIVVPRAMATSGRARSSP
jgi:predicted RNase H-like nuclease